MEVNRLFVQLVINLKNKLKKYSIQFEYFNHSKKGETMKFLILIVSSFLSFYVSACPGGSKTLNKGALTLRGDSVSVANLGTNKSSVTSTEDLLKSSRNFDWMEEGILFQVNVAYVHKDSEGVFYTIYELTEGSNDPRYIKVNTNYAGGGAFNRGMVPKFVISEEYGCQ